MGAALALVPTIIQALPSITVGVEELINFIGQVRTATQQTGEWTDAQEAQYQAAVKATTTDPAYQPDPPQS